MINNNLKCVSFMVLPLILLLAGCGEGVSTKTVTTPIDSFSILTSEEQETLNTLSTDQQKILDAINQERSQIRTCGDKGVFGPVPKLTWNTELYAAALEHVTDLAYSNTFSHDGSGTEYDITGNGTPSKFYERIVTNGYANYYSVGENIAAGQRSLTEVMKAWMKSPGHCENIMKNTYTEVGVAILIKEDSTYQVYWGQNFGSKKN